MLMGIILKVKLPGRQSGGRMEIDMEKNTPVSLTSLQETVRLFDRKHMNTLQIRRYPTGMRRLDRALGGGISAGMYILGAIPNLGKSTFALQIAQNLSASGIPVLFFSMEMTKNRIASKAISRQLFKNGSPVRYSSDMLLNQNTFIDPEAWAQIDRARQEVQEETKNLYVIERTEHIGSGEDIVRICEQYMDELGPDKKPVVMVDYLQILSGRKDRDFVSDRAIVDNNIRVLTMLATRKKLPVVVISAFNRSNYMSEVSMEAFKESGAIEYSADVILGMQLGRVGSDGFDLNAEKARNPRDIQIVILKQRYGKSGNTLSFRYYPANDYFEEAEGNTGTDDFFPELPGRFLD